RWPAVPDYCAPLVGWRAWLVAVPLPPSEIEPLLVSGNGMVIWPPAQALEAQHLPGPMPPSVFGVENACDGPPCSGHRPHQRPRCGIYAFAEAGDLQQALDPVWSEASFVIGTVALWGRVAVHDHGYRAQFAYPETIRAAWKCDGAQLAAVYGVPY